MDRKTSSGSDNVFDEGQMDRTVNGMIGDIGSKNPFHAAVSPPFLVFFIDYDDSLP